MNVGDRFVPWRMFRGADLPLGLASYAGLSARAKLVWAMLSYYGGPDGDSWPSQARLGKDCGLSRRTVIRALQELEEHCLIEQDGTKARRRKWAFLWHDCFNACVRPCHTSERGSVTEPHTTSAGDLIDGSKCADLSHDSVPETHITRPEVCESVTGHDNPFPSDESLTGIPSSSEIEGIPVAGPDDDGPLGLYLKLAGTKNADRAALEQLVVSHGRDTIERYLRKAEATGTCRGSRVIGYLKSCIANEWKAVSGHASRSKRAAQTFGL